MRVILRRCLHYGAVSVLRAFVASCRCSGFPHAALRRCGAARSAPTPEMTQSCPGLVATDRPRIIPACAQSRSGAHHLCRPRDLPDRKPAARAHRHRLQRLCPAADAARHRHHEPRALTHYTDRPDPGDQIRAARLGPERGRAGAPRRHNTRTCACATCRPISATGTAAPSATAIRSSSSRSPICASPISGICITR